jgi:hypothetical protein
MNDRKPPHAFMPGVVAITSAHTVVQVLRLDGPTEVTVKAVGSGQLISLRIKHLTALPGLAVLQPRDRGEEGEP